MPRLPPKVLAILDALHLRVPLRRAVFGTIDFYRRLKIPFIRRTIRRLEARKRAEIAATGRKIKVCFMCLDRSQWGMQSIYAAVNDTNKFETSILVSPNWIRHGSNNPEADAVKFFMGKGARVITSLDSKNLPDVLFTPYFDSSKFGNVADFHRIYKDVLLCIVMYSWIVTNSEKHFFGNNELAYFWKNFLFNDRELKLANCTPPLYGENTLAVGFPRNDEFLAAISNFIPTHSQFKKTIIWAPHWSILTHSRLGNFDRYAYPMLDWLKQHPDIQIILKPHPLLKARLTDPQTIERLKKEDPDFGVPLHFNDYEEYDLYMNKWKSLPNGDIMDCGEYADLFASSNGMILDSGSFMAEYMIFNKPMCFCNRDSSTEELKQKFNTFGRELLEGMTITSNWIQTEQFLNRVIVGDDAAKKEREVIISKYLNLNPRSVGAKITQEILMRVSSPDQQKTSLQ